MTPSYNLSAENNYFFSTSCYINELAVILAAYNVTVKLFVDDVKLYAEISTDVDVADLSRALSCIAEWADMWQLQISVTKCCAIHLNPKYVYSP